MTNSDVKELLQLFHQKVGRGGETEIEEAMGKAPRYLRNRRYKGSIDLGVFLEALRLADIHPVQFFAEIFGETTDDEDPDPPPLGGGSSGGVVTKARKRRSSGGSGKTSRAVLQEVDEELRYEDPAAAIDFLERHMEEINAEDVAYALGIYASSCRPLLLRSEAYEAIWHALRMATSDGDIPCKANLLQRYSHLKASLDGDHEGAFHLSAKASVAYITAGDLNGLGKVFVDQGGFHVNAGRMDQAVTCFRVALLLLDENDKPFRCAALQGQGVICAMREQTLEAARFFDEAVPFARTRTDVGKLAWMKGNALKDSHILDEAFTKLAPASPVDASLVACDHVKILLETGRIAKASKVIGTTRRLLEPLRMHRNPIATAALRDLICHESDGNQLTVAFITAVASRLRRSRLRRSRLNHPVRGQGQSQDLHRQVRQTTQRSTG